MVIFVVQNIKPIMTNKNLLSYQEIKGQPFFVDDRFYSDHEEYVHELSQNMLPEEFNEDFSEIVYGAHLEHQIQLDIDQIMECIFDFNEERFSEQNVDEELESIKKVLTSHINLENLNKAIPQLYYPTGKKYQIRAIDIKNDLDYEWKTYS